MKDLIVEDAEASGSLDQIDALVGRLRVAEDHVKEVEEALKLAKEQKNQIQLELLPTAMAEARRKKIEYSDGSVLSLRPFLEASIPSASAIKDAEPEEQEELVRRRLSALNWLRDNLGSAIIKNELVIEIPKGKDNIVSELTALCDRLELNYVRGEAVHPMTLKSFLKEKLRMGAQIPLDIFKLVTGNKAVLKRGK